MTWETALTLSIAILVLGITPGPGVFAIIARALAMGLRPTLVYITGIIAGDMVYLVLVALGLNVLVTQYADAFALLKIAGGLYLIYLGIQTWRSAKDVGGDGEGAIQAENSSVRSFLSGLSLTLGNHKVVVFYVAFLPAFIDLGALSISGLLIAALVVGLTLLVVFTGYAWMAARARRLLKTPAAVKTLRRGSAGLLIGAGGVVAAS
ncbi:MAG: LysE family translocator [Magnetovibrio sp.]|nr:LysE family translocator [Magnetovibrio sp.]